MAVNPGKPTIVRNYVLAAGQPVRLDDLFAECYVLLENAVMGSTEQEVSAALATGSSFMAQVGPLRQLVGVWVGAAGATLVTVVSR